MSTLIPFTNTTTLSHYTLDYILLHLTTLDYIWLHPTILDYILSILNYFYTYSYSTFLSHYIFLFVCLFVKEPLFEKRVWAGSSLWGPSFPLPEQGGHSPLPVAKTGRHTHSALGTVPWLNGNGVPPSPGPTLNMRGVGWDSLIYTYLCLVDVKSKLSS